MPYDEGLAQRVRDVLGNQQGLVEKKMFGGIAFMFRGNMSVGIVHDELMVRVGPEAYESALSEPHARKMDFTGKPLKGFVYVTGEGIEDDLELEKWIKRGFDFAGSLPAK